MTTLNQIYETVNDVIDFAFVREVYNFNFFEYLKTEKIKKQQIVEFLNSNFVTSLQHQIDELNLYLNDEDRNIVVAESYDWMGKFRVIKFRDYLLQIMKDAEKYEKTKRGGRPRKQPVQS